MKKFFQQMLLPLSAMLAILVWVAINNYSDWNYWGFAGYGVLFVGTILFSFFSVLDEAKSKVKYLEQIFSFVLICAFVFGVSFIFLASWLEIRLMITILLCDIVILRIFELLQAQPKRCRKAVYCADAMIAMCALIFVCSYIDGTDTIIAILCMLMSLFSMAVILSLIGYGLRWLWNKLWN